MKKSKILLLLANLVIAVIIFVIVNKKEDQKKDIVFEISELLSNLHPNRNYLSCACLHHHNC